MRYAKTIRDKCIECVEDGALSYAEISERYGPSTKTIALWAKRAGVQPRLGRKGASTAYHNKDKIRALLNQGRKASEIAETIGADVSLVRYYIRKGKL